MRTIGTFALRIIGCFVASGKGEFRSRPRARIIPLSRKVTVVAVRLRFELAAWFVVGCRCHQKFLAGIVDKGGA